MTALYWLKPGTGFNHRLLGLSLIWPFWCLKIYPVSNWSHTTPPPSLFSLREAFRVHLMCSVWFWSVLTEVRVLHGLSCRQPLLVVVAQQLVQQVQSLRTHQVLVLGLDELLPALPCLSGHRGWWQHVGRSTGVTNNVLQFKLVKLVSDFSETPFKLDFFQLIVLILLLLSREFNLHRFNCQVWQTVVSWSRVKLV